MRAFAPAKINLTLHVTGRLDDGYHILDSLVAFADIGDEIEIRESDEFGLEINGPFAKKLSSCGKNNLVTQAAGTLAALTSKKPNIHITLTKNLPLAAGIGGGSSDAATTVKTLLLLWNLSLPGPHLSALLRGLGADVPVCFYGQPARIRGTGETFEAVTLPKNIPIVLINPGRACPTEEVFGKFKEPFKKPHRTIPPLQNYQELISFLQGNNNGLLNAALKVVPEINNILQVFRENQNCAHAGLSGSGATCFGLFGDERAAKRAARAIQTQNPGWWVQNGLLNKA